MSQLGAGATGDLSARSISSFLNQDGRWKNLYPDSFFDPLSYLGRIDPKSLIIWSRFFYEWEPTVFAAINQMASYPITPFVIEAENDETKKKYQEAIEKLKLKDTVLQLGLDYFIAGNAFCSITPPFTRVISCRHCPRGSFVSMKEADIKPLNNRLTFTCSKCGATDTDLNIIELESQSLDDMYITLWDPLQMKIFHNEITNKSVYTYNAPAGIRSEIKRGNVRYLSTLPSSLLQAVKNEQAFEFSPNAIFHCKLPTHSSSVFKGWGSPLISHSLKHLFHLLLLMKGQDAILLDQLLPWKVMTPVPNSGTDPGDELDYGSWISGVKEQYAAWRKDPTVASVMPIPMQTNYIGGNAKQMLFHPEIEQTLQTILSGMGVPLELVRGGLSWSGSNIGLRMLEERMKNYRSVIQMILDLVRDILVSKLGFETARITMQELKMADDVAQKQFLVDLAMNKIISQKTLLEKTSPTINLEKEFDRKELEAAQEQKIRIRYAEVEQGRQQGVGPVSDSRLTTSGAMSEGGPGGASSSNPVGDLPTQRPPRSEGANQQI